MFRQVYNANSRRFSTSSSSSSADDDEEDNRESRESAAVSKGYSGRTVSQNELYQGRRRDSKMPKIQPPPPVPTKHYTPPPPILPPIEPIPMQQMVQPTQPMKAAFVEKKHQEFEQPAAQRSPNNHQQPTKHRSRRSHSENFNMLRTTFTAFLLFSAVIGYCFIGGFMFSYLEQSNELSECIQLRYLYQKTRNATAFTLYDIAASPDRGDEDKLEAFLPILDTLRSSIQNISWDGRNCETMQMKWSLVCSAFFSFTIVSTMGYGYIAPRTDWGRLVCIAYATVGLPLMLMALAKMGSLFAHAFRSAYFKAICCGLCIQRRRNLAKRRTSIVKRQQFRWKVDQSAGNKTEKSGGGFDLLEQDISSDEEETNQSTLGANVPLFLSMTVLALSVLVGMLVYVSLEKWSISDAAYFSFISLATIGLGDLVPGYNPLTGQIDDFKMIVTAGYIFWGMAVLSMALQMMQEEVVEKFRWLGIKGRLFCCRKKEEANNNKQSQKRGSNNFANPSKVGPVFYNQQSDQLSPVSMAQTPRVTNGTDWVAQLTPGSEPETPNARY